MFAKERLFEAAKNVVSDSVHVNTDLSDMPRFVVRRPGEGKRKLDAHDLLDLLSYFDTKKFELPVFATGELERVPQFSPDATDFCAMTANVELL